MEKSPSDTPGFSKFPAQAAKSVCRQLHVAIELALKDTHPVAQDNSPRAFGRGVGARQRVRGRDKTLGMGERRPHADL